MAAIHPILQFLLGVATIGAALGLLGVIVDVAFREEIGKRVHHILLEASAFTWSLGLMIVVVFVAWIYIVQQMLFEAAMLGLMGALVLYIFAFFLYPEATEAMGEAGEASE